MMPKKFLSVVLEYEKQDYAVDFALDLTREQLILAIKDACEVYSETVMPKLTKVNGNIQPILSTDKLTDSRYIVTMCNPEAKKAPIQKSSTPTKQNTIKRPSEESNAAVHSTTAEQPTKKLRKEKERKVSTCDSDSSSSSSASDNKPSSLANKKTLVQDPSEIRTKVHIVSGESKDEIEQKDGGGWRVICIGKNSAYKAIFEKVIEVYFQGKDSKLGNVDQYNMRLLDFQKEQITSVTLTNLSEYLAMYGLRPSNKPVFFLNIIRKKSPLLSSSKNSSSITRRPLLLTPPPPLALVPSPYKQSLEKRSSTATTAKMPSPLSQQAQPINSQIQKPSFVSTLMSMKLPLISSIPVISTTAIAAKSQSIDNKSSSNKLAPSTLQVLEQYKRAADKSSSSISSSSNNNIIKKEPEERRGQPTRHSYSLPHGSHRGGDDRRSYPPSSSHSDYQRHVGYFNNQARHYNNNYGRNFFSNDRDTSYNRYNNQCYSSSKHEFGSNYPKYK